MLSSYVSLVVDIRQLFMSNAMLVLLLRWQVEMKYPCGFRQRLTSFAAFAVGERLPTDLNLLLNLLTCELYSFLFSCLFLFFFELI